MRKYFLSREPNSLHHPREGGDSDTACQNKPLGEQSLSREWRGLQPPLNHSPVNRLEKRFDIVRALQSVVKHKRMFKHIHDEQRLRPDKISRIMLIYPDIEKQMCIRDR